MTTLQPFPAAPAATPRFSGVHIHDYLNGVTVFSIRSSTPYFSDPINIGVWYESDKKHHASGWFKSDEVDQLTDGPIHGEENLIKALTTAIDAVPDKFLPPQRKNELKARVREAESEQGEKKGQPWDFRFTIGDSTMFHAGWFNDQDYKHLLQQIASTLRYASLSKFIADRIIEESSYDPRSPEDVIRPYALMEDELISEDTWWNFAKKTYSSSTSSEKNPSPKTPVTSFQEFLRWLFPLRFGLSEK